MRLLAIAAFLTQAGSLAAQPIRDAAVREMVRVASDTARSFAVARHPNLSRVGLLIDRQFIAATARQKLGPEIFVNREFDGLPAAGTFSFTEKYACSQQLKGALCQRPGFSYMHILAFLIRDGSAFEISGRYEYPLGESRHGESAATYAIWGDFFWAAKFVPDGKPWRLDQFRVWYGPSVYR
jgi:hypothetical protein